MGALSKSFMVTVLFLGASGLSLAPGQDKKDAKKDDKAAAVVFEVYKDKGGEYRYRLKAGDHSLANSGHGYKTIDDVEKVIDHIKRDAAKAKIVDHTKAKKDDKAAAVVFEVYKDKGGEYRFRLKAGDHSLAISGHGYKTIDDVEKVIDHIKRDAAKAKIVDHTKAK